MTVQDLAKVVGMPLERLLEQLRDAGLAVNSAESKISEEQKSALLGYLHKIHGKSATDPIVSPRRITLKRKSISKLTQGSATGGGAKTITVEVRKKKTYIKRSESKHPSALKEHELAQKALMEQQQAMVAEEHRLHLESQAHHKHEEEKKRQVLAKQKAKQERLQQQEEALKRAEQVAKKQETQKQKEQESQQTPVAAPKNNVTNIKPTKKKVEQRSKSRTYKDNWRSTDNRKRRKKGRATVSFQDATQDDNKHKFEKPVVPVVKEAIIPETIIVSDLAQKLSIKVADIIKQLIKLGIMATINQSIDQETAVILVEELGHKAIIKNDDNFEKDVLANFDTEEHEYFPRAPIVTIMGHVDHGKTSLLDYIKKTQIAEGEVGGITQHIGAYQVFTDHGSVTFLDTPGHAAFTAMRARGAEVTDVVIVVVAADDGVMPQTKEAIEHARAADVPIIVAVSKIDKKEVDAKKVMQELATIEVIPEAWGGDTQFIEISAKTGQGIDDLIEALILQAEILELKAPKVGLATGFVIEVKLDKGRGVVATVLVQEGTLRKGEIVLCGHELGRIRTMHNEHGQNIKEATPSTPVEIVGLSGTPVAGEKFYVVPNERKARELAERREEQSKSKRLLAQQTTRLDEVFSIMEAGEEANLNVVIKTDVQGSLEALRESLIKLSTEEVRVRVVYGGVGGINESDVNLALVSNAIVVGFNVRADATSRKLIAEKGVDLRYYSIIYNAIDEVKKLLSGMLSPNIKEKIFGIAEVRDVFRSPKFGSIAGCMVIEGVVARNMEIRVLRNNIVIYEGQLESLRRFKEDISEVKSGMECGIGVKNYNDVKVNDQIEVFEHIEVQREL